MSEPILLGYPVTQLILFFFFYAFVGWVMETCYCSFIERKYVARGFLYGPICPIYGVGVLLMILFFKPLTGNPVLFYITAVVVMSSWEYFVAWLLETTTHVKYWDYSHFKYNLNGRICLPISLTWGVLSYIVIFWIHPHTEALFAQTALTIRQLALIAKLTKSLARISDELQLQLSLGKSELSDKLDESTAALRTRYEQQIRSWEENSRRFRKNYHLKLNRNYHISLEDLRAAGELAREELQRAANQRKAAKAKKKAK